MLTFPENRHKISQFICSVTCKSFKSHTSHGTATSSCFEPTDVIHTFSSGRPHRYQTWGEEIPPHSRLTCTSSMPFQDCQQTIINIKCHIQTKIIQMNTSGLQSIQPFLPYPSFNLPPVQISS